MNIRDLLNFFFKGASEPKKITLNQAVAGNAGKGIVDVSVEDEQLLIRDVTFPRMAKNHLKRAIALNIDSQTPFNSKTILVGYTVFQRDAQQQEVRQFILRRSQIDEWNAKLSGVGLTARKFVAESAPEAVFQDNTDTLTLPYKKWKRANAGLGVAAVVLIGVLAWQNVTKLDKEMTAAQDDVAALRHDISQLRANLDANGGRASGLTEIRVRQNESLKMLERMNAMTLALPDDTWVTLISFETDHLIVTGNTLLSPTDLIPILAGTVNFDTPVLLNGFPLDDGSGQQRFELSVPYAVGEG